MQTTVLELLGMFGLLLTGLHLLDRWRVRAMVRAHKELQDREWEHERQEEVEEDGEGWKIR